MAYTTITFAQEHLDSSNYLQLEIKFVTDSEQNWTAASRNMSVLSYGTLDWSYDLEDLLLVPGVMSLKIGDGDGDLDNLFFGASAALNRRPKITLRRNGTIEFLGYVMEDTITSNPVGTKIVEFSAAPRMERINQKFIFDEENNALNPLGYTLNIDQNRNISEMIQRTFRLVDTSIDVGDGSLDISQPWLFKGERYYPSADSNVLEDIAFTEIETLCDAYFNHQERGFASCGDVLREFCIEFGAFAGMIHEQKAFFHKLFYYDASVAVALTNVLSHIKEYPYSLLTATHIVTAEVSYLTGSPVTANQVNYYAGEYHGLSGRSLLRETVVPFFRIAGAGYSEYTNTIATIARGGSDDGKYKIYYLKDSDISSSWLDYGRLLADYWYYWRGNLENSRIDKFVCSGIEYDFLVPFNYGGYKYQIIGMRKDWGNMQTEIEAIYLGAV